VHSKLLPMRQKGREFFNINADDAYAALTSILDSQTEIKKIIAEEILAIQETPMRKKWTTSKHDLEYAELFQSFEALLKVKGRPFGQLNRPNFGMSDGNEGVQWNLSVSADSGVIRLGVNLEGMEYSNWPISNFILSEIGSPKIEEVAAVLNDPNDIYIRFARDAWQAAARPNIVEKYLGGREFSFAEINSDQWSNTLKEALGCLNEEKNYRGRANQTVTLVNKPKNGEQVRVMEVSPHLNIGSPLSLNGNIHENIELKLAELQPVYDWVKRVSQA